MLFSGNPFKRPWGFILITLLFACVGAGIFLFVLTPIIYDGLRMSFWPSTKGNLVDVRRAFHKSGESREHTAYDIQARYSYSVEGVGYSNDRIYISEFSYNSGSAHQDLSRSLEVAFASKNPITIWYNYDNPQQSIVDRTLKWDLIFTLFILSITFMALGVGGTILLWRADNPPGEFSSAKPPWLQLRCWRTNRIKSQCSGHVAEAWFWNLVWNGLSISTSIKTVPQSLESGNYGGLIVLVFPIVGLALWFWVFKVTRDFVRFGDPVLLMQPYPGRIGGEVGGNIRLSKVKSCRLKLTLSCVLVKPRFDGDGNDNEAIVWLNKLDADFNPEVNGTSLGFRFDVPAGLPPSGRPQLRGGYHLWRLDIESLDLAVQFAREYRIPVFGVYRLGFMPKDSSVFFSDFSRGNSQSILFASQFLKKLQLLLTIFLLLGFKIF